MKRLLFLLTLPSTLIHAQPAYKYGSFVIKGHIDNFKEPLFDVMTTTYLGSVQNSVKVLPNGNFEKVLPVQNKQKFDLRINNEHISFTVQDKDTITLNCTQTDSINHFFINGKNETRTAELQKQLKLFIDYNTLSQNLSMTVREKNLSAADKYKLINELYNRNVNAVFDSSGLWTENINQLITGLYFRYSYLLVRQNLTPEYKLQFHLDGSMNYPSFDMIHNADYTQLNEDWFWNVPDYRHFIEFYLGLYKKPFTNYKSSTSDWSKTFNATLDNYYKAQFSIGYQNIKDWFVTNSIISDFQSYDFAKVEKVYKMAATSVTSHYLKDTLLKYYTAIKRLRPGSPAPGFTLKNDKGQTVSLNDFKGKVVYIDFWGVTCGPCIVEIKQANPALHRHYENKDVVFVNVCVDAKLNEWKEALSDYKLDGVNLIAEGWTLHPTCKAYNVNALPHYVLIDKSGKIASNTAPNASMLNLTNGKNEIDMLLK